MLFHDWVLLETEEPSRLERQESDPEKKGLLVGKIYLWGRRTNLTNTSGTGTDQSFIAPGRAM